jgi:cytochrome c6
MSIGKIGAVVFCSALFLGAVAACGNAGGGSGKAAPDGKALFEKNCAVCHKDGGNIINPKKTLKSADLKANGITKPEDIVKKMREPGPGMTKFDKATIPDNEAKAIAKYVLSAF